LRSNPFEERSIDENQHAPQKDSWEMSIGSRAKMIREVFNWQLQDI
jgi:hypothetical protein